MSRYLRLEDFKLLPKEPVPLPPQKPNRYFCEKCNRYHLIYSNIGNDHREYKLELEPIINWR